MKRTVPLLLAACWLAAGLAGCKSGGGGKADPLIKLSAEESLVTGKQLLANRKYDRARPYFTHAFEVEPNSRVGRESLLLAADSYFMSGGSGNYIQAEAKYRDYLNRFPTSEQAPYVQFQIANSLAKRMERPDRDQTVTRKALQAYQELIRLYPTSEYAARGQEQVEAVKGKLAEHEFIVGNFYLRYGVPVAAAERYEFLLENYPAYGGKDKVIYNLGLAYQRSRKMDEARKAFDRLRTEFPNSPLVREIPDLKVGA